MATLIVVVIGIGPVVAISLLSRVIFATFLTGSTHASIPAILHIAKFVVIGPAIGTLRFSLSVSAEELLPDSLAAFGCSARLAFEPLAPDVIDGGLGLHVEELALVLADVTRSEKGGLAG